jgi:hypothetical protein
MKAKFHHVSTETPNNSPLKPLHRNHRVKAMKSMDWRGFGLYPLV